MTYDHSFVLYNILEAHNIGFWGKIRKKIFSVALGAKLNLITLWGSSFICLQRQIHVLLKATILYAISGRQNWWLH